MCLRTLPRSAACYEPANKVGEKRIRELEADEAGDEWTRKLATSKNEAFTGKGLKSSAELYFSVMGPPERGELAP